MKSWTKTAGIAGILIILLSALFMIMELSGIGNTLLMNQAFSFFQSLIVLLLYVVFYYGFVVIGKKYNKKLLKISSLFLILYSFLLIIMIILYSLLAKMNPSLSIQSAYLTISSVIVIFGALFGILFGIGLILSRKAVKYALIAGIIHIIYIAGGVSFSYLGILIVDLSMNLFIILSLIFARGLLLLSLILEIIILLKASRQMNPNKRRSRKKRK